MIGINVDAGGSVRKAHRGSPRLESAERWCGHDLGGGFARGTGTQERITRNVRQHGNTLVRLKPLVSVPLSHRGPLAKRLFSQGIPPMLSTPQQSVLTDHELGPTNGPLGSTIASPGRQLRERKPVSVELEVQGVPQLQATLDVQLESAWRAVANLLAGNGFTSDPSVTSSRGNSSHSHQGVVSCGGGGGGSINSSFPAPVPVETRQSTPSSGGGQSFGGSRIMSPSLLEWPAAASSPTMTPPVCTAARSPNGSSPQGAPLPPLTPPASARSWNGGRPATSGSPVAGIAVWSRPQSPWGHHHGPPSPATAPAHFGRPSQGANHLKIDRRAAWAAFMPESAFGLLDCDQAVASVFEVLRSSSVELCRQLKSGELERSRLQAEIIMRTQQLQLLDDSLKRLEEERDEHDQRLLALEEEHAKIVDSSRALLEVVLHERRRLPTDLEEECNVLESN
mmetsp:Transcript_49382/g.130191  ORF Transcript_49382/g.130191 Transcript_49382/m.130191 type:complete len:452 (-) Transcript_49382:23-1378(-)